MIASDRNGIGREWPAALDRAARPVAAVVMAGGILTPVAATALGASWQPLVLAAALAMIAAGTVLLVAEMRRDLGRRLSLAASDARGVAQRVDRSAAEVATIRDGVALLDKTVAGERRNLGLIAEGLGEMRQLVDLERGNLGLVAHNLEEVREMHRVLHEGLEAGRGELQAAAAMLHDLHRQLGVERRNLGLVAGALDDVRRQAAGVHLFDARQAAFEDMLVAIADRVDAIGGPAPMLEPGRSEPGDRAGATEGSA